MSVDQELGQNISAVRRAAGMSLADAAAIIGVSEFAFRSIEAGKQRIGSVLLYKLSKVFDLELRWFFDSSVKSFASMDCIRRANNQSKGECSNILSSLRLNETLRQICDAANHAADLENKTVAVV